MRCRQKVVTEPIFPERLQNLVPVGIYPLDGSSCAQMITGLYFPEKGANAKNGRIELTGLSGDEEGGTSDRVF